MTGGSWLSSCGSASTSCTTPRRVRPADWGMTSAAQRMAQHQVQEWERGRGRGQQGPPGRTDAPVELWYLKLLLPLLQTRLQVQVHVQRLLFPQLEQEQEQPRPTPGAAAASQCPSWPRLCPGRTWAWLSLRRRRRALGSHVL
jgi:hypothetical protein